MGVAGRGGSEGGGKGAKASAGWHKCVGLPSRAESSADLAYLPLFADERARITAEADAIAS